MEIQKSKSDTSNNPQWKIRPIGGPLGDHGFQLDSVYMDEGMVKIIFHPCSYPPNERQDELLEVTVKDYIHFDRTDESNRIVSLDHIILLPNSNGKNQVNPLFSEKGERFFEVLDKKYIAWVGKERYFPMHEEYKMYVFLFGESYIEVISASPPVFRKISSKQEFYDGLKERVFLNQAQTRFAISRFFLHLKERVFLNRTQTDKKSG